MNERKKVKFKDIASFISHKTSVDNATVDNYISTVNMLPEKQGVSPIDEIPIAKTVNQFKKEDILISNIRPYFKKIWYAKGNGTNSGDVLVIRRKSEEADNKYLYYSLFDDNFFNFMMSGSKGTKMPRGDKEAIKNYEIPLPPLPTQRRIAAILSALDDKIENNRRICETLEQIAQAVFKRWFVNFDFPDDRGRPYKSSGGRMVESELGPIPEGWEVGVLNDLVTNINESCNTNNKKLPYLPIDVIPKSKLGIENYDSWENARSSLIKFKEDDIIIGAMRIYFHRVVLSPFSGITRTTCIILRPKSKSDRLFSLFHVNQDNFIEWASNNSKGSTMPYAFWNNGIENHKIVIPPVFYREEFEKIISPLVQIIKTDYKNSISLQQTRDTLLPKLMSGEVEV